MTEAESEERNGLDQRSSLSGEAAGVAAIEEQSGGGQHQRRLGRCEISSRKEGGGVEIRDDEKCRCLPWESPPADRHAAPWCAKDDAREVPTTPDDSVKQVFGR
ncbi:hypothetical protein THAOC_06841 [Thalassiosira oceanica]|uniref:Uncharacterized protein n=1 Tax=Thalassiosira oceanica TaxID=159749 RepID=K0SZF7_THAOC|nr:hypothetical protein THAOC_06841 [Thalassiosira oceanica]|eukprot:EJK71693.1 hypothetical protein THAOC_06841 [Thalassiosira oceanica]